MLCAMVLISKQLEPYPQSLGHSYFTLSGDCCSCPLAASENHIHQYAGMHSAEPESVLLPSAGLSLLLTSVPPVFIGV